MRGALKKLSTISWLEWRIILYSLVMLPLCALSLRRNGFVRTRDKLLTGRFSASQLPREEQLAVAQRIARGVAIAANHGIYRANCLKRALILAKLLHLRGIEHELKLGAKCSDDDFSAHAWVEFDGVVLNDDPEVREKFAVLEPGAKQGH